MYYHVNGGRAVLVFSFLLYFLIFCTVPNNVRYPFFWLNFFTLITFGTNFNNIRVTTVKTQVIIVLTLMSEVRDQLIPDNLYGVFYE